MSLQSATFPEPKMDAPETTATPTDTGMELPDDPGDGELQNMSKEQVVALCKRRGETLRECQQNLHECQQNLHSRDVELRDYKLILPWYMDVFLSLVALSQDFNDGTAETTGAAGITGYVKSPELSDGTTGAWFQYARE
jgi:hypothetical protein